MVDGMLDGVNVSRDNDAPVRGSTKEGAVWAGADGYRVYGAIKSIDIEDPSHVQLRVNKMESEPVPPEGEGCQVTVRMESVDFISGQGAGEGALELTIESDIHGEQSAAESVRLPTGSSQNIAQSIESFEVASGRSLTKQLTAKVTEREVPSDWFTGNDDYGESTTDIVLQCGEPKTVSQTVKISSDQGNPGKVRVNYTIGDLSR
ncbi:hypothetical protein EKH57_14365 [Halorubrum sp. BOL3-1]|nr:hypothetical protein EKH57_14365 [Halorubrum sp. BOL3-1]